MKIYLDACAIQRPFDDRSQIRVGLEADAVLAFIELIDEGKLELVSSDVLELELEQIPTQTRMRYSFEVLQKATSKVDIDEQIKLLATNYQKSGLKVFDAMHLASAVVAKVDYLCTCDDRFVKQAKRILDLPLKVVSPLELAEEI